MIREKAHVFVSTLCGESEGFKESNDPKEVRLQSPNGLVKNDECPIGVKLFKKTGSFETCIEQCKKCSVL